MYSLLHVHSLDPTENREDRVVKRTTTLQAPFRSSSIPSTSKGTRALPKYLLKPPLNQPWQISLGLDDKVILYVGDAGG